MLLGALVMMVFISASLRPWVVLDADVFWHLATGREMAESGRILRADPFSYAFAGQPWVNHEWLFQWLFWGWFGVAGAGGLYVAAGVAMGLGVAMPVWWAGRRLGLGPLGMAAGGAMALAATAAFPHPRPTAFTMCLAALVAVFVPAVWQTIRARAAGEPAQWPGLAAVIGLPLLFVLWANLHATFPLGLAVLAAGLAGAWWQDRETEIRGSAGGSAAWKSGLMASGFLAVCALATLANPFLWGVWLVPLKVAGSPLFRGANAEWMRPDGSAEFWAFWMMVPFLLVGGVALWRRDRGWVLMAAVLLAGALGSRRLIPWLAVVGGVVGGAGVDWLLSRSGRGFGLNFAGRRALIVMCATALAMVAVHGWWIGRLITPEEVRPVGFGLKAGSTAYPVEMARRLAELRPGGKVFNDYNHGGYLHLAIGPRWLVGMDGRNDLFGEELVRRYEALATGRAGIEEELDRWGVDAALLSWPMALADGGIYQQLAPGPAWVCAGFDDAGVLLVRRSAFDPARLAPVELQAYVPVLTPAANIARGRRLGTLARMRSEIDRLARSTGGHLAGEASTVLAEALGDGAAARPRSSPNSTGTVRRAD